MQAEKERTEREAAELEGATFEPKLSKLTLQLAAGGPHKSPWARLNKAGTSQRWVSLGIDEGSIPTMACPQIQTHVLWGFGVERPVELAQLRSLERFKGSGAWNGVSARVACCWCRSGRGCFLVQEKILIRKKEKDEEETKECTFKPAINHNSVRMVAQRSQSLKVGHAHFPESRLLSMSAFQHSSVHARRKNCNIYCYFQRSEECPMQT